MNMVLSLALGVAALSLLTGCNRAEQSGEPAAPTLTSWSSIPHESVHVPEGVVYAVVDIAGVPAAEISNVPADAISAQSTGGVSVRLPDAIESEASGKRVRITVRASAAQNGSVIAVAYSTNDTGNSGWHNLTLSNAPADYSFTYDVPVIQNGNGDYLGFRSYNQGHVQVLGYRVEVLGPSAAAPLANPTSP